MSLAEAPPFLLEGSRFCVLGSQPLRRPGRHIWVSPAGMWLRASSPLRLVAHRDGETGRLGLGCPFVLAGTCKSCRTQLLRSTLPGLRTWLGPGLRTFQTQEWRFFSSPPAAFISKRSAAVITDGVCCNFSLWQSACNIQLAIWTQSAQFRRLQGLHAAVRPSPPATSRMFSSPQEETLSPLSNNSPSPRLPASQK